MAKIKTKKQEEPKQLPTVTVTSKLDPKLKRYQDSLNLYNASVDMGKDVASNIAKGYHKMDLDEVKKGTMSNKEAERRYQNHLKFYNEALVEPITKGKKVAYGGIAKWNKETEGYLKKSEEFYKKGLKDNQFVMGMAQGSKDEYNSVVNNYKKINSLNKRIKPIGVLEQAELASIPIYKKPVQPVEYKEEPHKDTTQRLKENPKAEIKHADVKVETPKVEKTKYSINYRDDNSDTGQSAMYFKTKQEYKDALSKAMKGRGFVSSSEDKESASALFYNKPNINGKD
jgi:hypothetical protein